MQLLSKYILFSVIFINFSPKAIAGFGIFESYVILGGNYYDLYANTTNPDFSNANLGTFTQGGSFIFNGGEIKTYKENQSGCPGGNVCGGKIYLVIETSSGTFVSSTSYSFGYNSELGVSGCSQNQKWDITNGSFNIISGLATGNYNLKINCDATGHQTSYSACDNTVTQSQLVASFAIQAPAPVTWSSFNVITTGNQNRLSWSTASEENCDYFIAEKSIDGINFSDIGQVDGSGTTVQTNNYTLEDRFPFSGTNYYRIKQVDFDKKYSFSPIRSIKNEVLKRPKLFPSIAENQITLMLPTKPESEIKFNVISQSSGFTLKQFTIDQGKDEVQLNISSLPAGNYMIISADGQFSPLRFTKL
jgi:hypothetical protein